MPSRWEGKHALLVGATQGLGKSMAKCLAEQGCALTIVARNRERLLETQTFALDRGAPSVQTIEADACREDAFSSHVANCLDAASPIDLGMNFVGRSDRGKLLRLQESDLIDSYRINVISAWNVARVCIPRLSAHSGTLVLVGSLASHLAPAGLGSYALCKFPLVAMRQQLALEVDDNDCHIMLVCPGPIRRDEEGRYRELAAARGLPDSASRPAGGAKLNAIDPDWLCRRMLRGIEHKEREIIVPAKAKAAIVLSRWFPRLGDWILRKNMSHD